MNWMHKDPCILDPEKCDKSADANVKTDLLRSFVSLSEEDRPEPEKKSPHGGNAAPAE